MEDNSVNSNSRIGMIKEIKFWSGNEQNSVIIIMSHILTVSAMQTLRYAMLRTCYSKYAMCYKKLCVSSIICYHINIHVILIISSWITVAFWMK